MNSVLALTARPHVFPRIRCGKNMPTMTPNSGTSRIASGKYLIGSSADPPDRIARITSRRTGMRRVMGLGGMVVDSGRLVNRPSPDRRSTVPLRQVRPPHVPRVEAVQLPEPL